MFWASRKFKDCARHFFSEKRKGTLIVATQAQKHFVKEYLLSNQGGYWGLEIHTPAEFKRLQGTIMNREIAAVLATQLGEQNTQNTELALQDFVMWLEAGHPAEKTPLPAKYKTPLIQLFTQLKGKKVAWSENWLPPSTTLMGFDAIEAANLLRRNSNKPQKLYVIEPNNPSPARMGAISFLESVYAPLERLDDGQIAEVFAFKTTPTLLKTALIHTLLEYPKIKRVIGRGLEVQALLSELHFPTQPNTPMGLSERIKLYVEAELNPNYFNILNFLRNETLWQKIDLSELQKLETKSREQLQETGVYPRELLPWKGLPPIATPAQYARLSETALGFDFESLLKQLEAITHLLPKGQLSREVWLDLIKAPTHNRADYENCWVVAYEEALGLLDEEALLLTLSSKNETKETLLSKNILEEYNCNQLIENENGPFLRGGWLDKNLNRPIQEECELTNILAGCEITQKTIHRVYRQKNTHPAQDPELVAIHTQRRNINTPFGQYDYQCANLDPSCKQWESVVLNPELAWYELHRLRPLWSPEDNPEALWVGNWVHDALSFYFKNKKETFKETDSSPSLLWRLARVHARDIYEYFKTKISEQTEYSVVGVEQIVDAPRLTRELELRLHGRLDMLLKTPEGGVLIVDFKTSSSSKKISKDIQKGDGLQLWLYARALVDKFPSLAICRLPPGGLLEPQKQLEPALLTAEIQMLKISKTGILGQGGENLFGRFGKEDRLPYALLPIDDKILKARKALS